MTYLSFLHTSPQYLPRLSSFNSFQMATWIFVFLLLNSWNQHTIIFINIVSTLSSFYVSSFGSKSSNIFVADLFFCFASERRLLSSPLSLPESPLIVVRFCFASAAKNSKIHGTLCTALAADCDLNNDHQINTDDTMIEYGSDDHDIYKFCAALSNQRRHVHYHWG